MNILVPKATPIIWALDRDPSNVDKMQLRLTNRVPDATYHGFRDPEMAYRALNEIGESDEAPCLIIHDQVAMTSLPQCGNDTFQGLLRRKTPLTYSHLFSESAFLVENRVDTWLRQGEIDDATRKPQWTSLMSKIAALCKRWVRPSLVRLRDLIRDCKDPCVKEIPTKQGGYLSLIDVHREIARKSKLGNELEPLLDTICQTARKIMVGGTGPLARDMYGDMIDDVQWLADEMQRNDFQHVPGKYIAVLNKQVIDGGDDET